MNDSLTKSDKIIVLKSIFDVNNQRKFKKKSLENINLEDNFLQKKTFFFLVSISKLLLLITIIMLNC